MECSIGLSCMEGANAVETPDSELVEATVLALGDQETEHPPLAQQNFWLNLTQLPRLAGGRRLAIDAQGSCRSEELEAAVRYVAFEHSPSAKFDACTYTVESTGTVTDLGKVPPPDSVERRS